MNGKWIPHNGTGVPRLALNKCDVKFSDGSIEVDVTPSRYRNEWLWADAKASPDNIIAWRRM